MTFVLKNAFWTNARGITFTDGGGITWMFNSNTNSISATASASGTVTSIGSTTLTIGGTASVPTVNLSTAQQTNIAAGGTALQSVPAAVPSASVGLTAVAGTATSFTRSDGAPKLSQAIVPVWTAVHTFAPAAAGSNQRILTSLNTSSGVDDVIQRAGSAANTIGAGPNTEWFDSTNNTATLIQQAGGQTETWVFSGGWAQLSKYLTNGNFQLNYGFACHGVTPPTQTTGWGTPTGASVVANFAGASAGLTTCSAAIAEIITILKAYGLIGA